MNPWSQIELGTVVAERQLFLDGEGSVMVRIGMPLMSESEPQESACPWQIQGLGSGRLRCTVGIDRAQSLRLAFEMIGATLYASEEYRSGRLKAFADSDDRGDLGFPIPRGFEDLVPSSDAGGPNRR